MEVITAADSTFATDGVHCFAGSLVVNGRSVLLMNICVVNPAHQNLPNVMAKL